MNSAYTLKSGMLSPSYNHFERGYLLMIGGIYSRQKCLLCGGSHKDTGKRLACPKHPEQIATSFYVQFRRVQKRFHSYQEARNVLTGLRYKAIEGTFDERDYRKEKPLSFENLGREWLKRKQKSGLRCMRNPRNHIARASSYFGDRNIKDIDYADLDDFLFSLPDHLSSKTKQNILTTLHSFWVWVAKRERKKNPTFSIPEFPKIRFELKRRQTIPKETQRAILEEVRRISAQSGLKTIVCSKSVLSLYSRSASV